MDADDLLNSISFKINGCAFVVAKQLREGYLEKVYENALVHEMRKRGLRVAQQVPLEVLYSGVVVGHYIADIIVEGLILIELKATESITDAHVAQALNYLTTTKLPLCLILNFGEERVKIKRVRL
ncbi:MAG TPA: GxxExxY protein [Abditibacterium sp.]